MLTRVSNSTFVRTMIMNLEPGEILLIERKDWRQKNGPGMMCGVITRKYGRKFKVDTLVDGSGWLVERLED
jgi:hypothetical protein